jgi:hypothetical protein
MCGYIYKHLDTQHHGGILPVSFFQWAVLQFEREAITQGRVDPALSAFTIDAWTSMTRNITNPDDLVFHMRSDDGKLAPADIKTVGHGIVRSTLV